MDGTVSGGRRVSASCVTDGPAGYVKVTRLLFCLILASTSGSAAGQICTISSVLDGDSLRVHCSQQEEMTQVRLAQIDAPELRQEHGKASRSFLRFICPVGMKVRIESRGQGQHKHTLGTVICNEINANIAMVMAGHAWAYSRYSPATKMHKLQDKARANHTGLWRRPDPVAPWEFRKMGR
ncbi:hypothetical protein CR159_18950 [Pollutimonas subterranea]|uniref:TNase-like domain-containing protein n=2 Tax=Pollutimonas subterranea TaxID=2045210 RepID=A0A2N4TZT3_9BURK|nr:hypothetical protein CR159_18950 [Pollutimonas subterranea]